jgi:hypothetical protein
MPNGYAPMKPFIIGSAMITEGAGSPRASRAWPLALPSPSGPLGRQRLRRSRVGPEDPFCEAGRKDLGVPLTLEGRTRTMRGVPSRCLWPFARRSAHSVRARRPGPARVARHRGVTAGTGCGRCRGSRPATASPPATLPLITGHPAALLSPGCSRQLA